jgi:hypothetical protein
MKYFLSVTNSAIGSGNELKIFILAYIRPSGKQNLLFVYVIAISSLYWYYELKS